MQQEALEKGFVTKDGNIKKLEVLKYKQFLTQDFIVINISQY